MSSGAARYEPCGFTTPCTGSLQCLGICHLPCDAGCLEDESCISFGGDDRLGVCGQPNGLGGTCDFFLALICEEGLYCNDEGRCDAPELVYEGEECGGEDLGCEAGLACIPTGPEAGLCLPECEEDADCDLDESCVVARFAGGACFVSCSPGAVDACPDGYQCREQFGGSDVACLPERSRPGGGGSGETVGFGAPCSRELSCEEGFFCPPGVPGAYCTRECESPGDCPSEPEGATCEGLSLNQACIFTCTGSDDGCPEGMTCDTIFGQSVCTY